MSVLPRYRNVILLKNPEMHVHPRVWNTQASIQFVINASACTSEGKFEAWKGQMDDAKLRKREKNIGRSLISYRTK